MSVLVQMPSSTRGRSVALAGGALAWAVSYWVNEQLWDLLFHGLLGMDPQAHLTQSLHFFSMTWSRSRCCCPASSS